MNYLKAMLAVVLVALLASAPALGSAVCTVCYEGDATPFDSGIFARSGAPTGLSDSGVLGTSAESLSPGGTVLEIPVGVQGEPRRVLGILTSTTATIEYRIKLAAHTSGAGHVGWQARQRSGSTAYPSWHFNMQQPGNVTFLFGTPNTWPLNGSQGTWTPDTFSTYRVAYKPNGANWDWEFSQGEVISETVRNVINTVSGTDPSATHADNNFLNGTADKFSGITWDYLRIVEGQFVPSGEPILVPEPATLGLLLVGGGIVLRRTRKSA